jgi:hypothetical protein
MTAQPDDGVYEKLKRVAGFFLHVHCCRLLSLCTNAERDEQRKGGPEIILQASNCNFASVFELYFSRVKIRTYNCVISNSRDGTPQ